MKGANYSDEKSQILQEAAKNFVDAHKKAIFARKELDYHILMMRYSGFSLAQILTRLKDFNITGYQSRQCILNASNRALDKLTRLEDIDLS